MQTTVTTLFNEVREVLADINKSRWTDQRLIDLLNSGMKHLVINANLLKREKIVVLNIGQLTYDLSDEILNLYRVEYEDEPIRLVTHEEMDRINPRWKSETASEDNPTLNYIIYDKRNRGIIKVNPIPQKVLNFVVSSPYGIITDIQTTDEDITLYTDDTLPNDVVQTDYFRMYYNARPFKYVLAHATDATTLVDTSDMWDEALKYWILGHAFGDNKSEQDLANSQKYLSLYSGELANITSHVEENFTQGDRRTDYNGGFQ